MISLSRVFRPNKVFSINQNLFPIDRILMINQPHGHSELLNIKVIHALIRKNKL